MERIGPVELRRLDLALNEADLAVCWATLSEGERRRAERLAPEVRRRFIAARGALRQTLAGYVGEPAEALLLVDGAHGKPMLAGGPRFNLSHSGELALCAVAWGRSVGVDLEYVRPIPEGDSIAARWLGPQDWATYRAAGDRGRGSTFMRLWTRREAYLKAQGLGIVGAGAPEDIDPSQWEVRDLRPSEGYVGALVWERDPRRSRSAPGARIGVPP